MFKKSVVLAVKVNGQVLREFDDTVYIPFGSEYTVLIKNLSNSRIRVKMKIDGDDVMDGDSLIVGANSDAELKRFIRNGNLNEGNSFKFIEKTDKVTAHRGNRAEDGLLTITWEREAEITSISGQLLRSKGAIRNPSDMAPMSAVNDFYSSPVTLNAAGVTAPGSVNTQQFTRVSSFIGSGQSESMTVQMKGHLDTNRKSIEVPITVTRLTDCNMCGTKVRQTDKFCHECGASVILV